MLDWLRLALAPKDAVMGINRRNLEMVRRRNARRHFPIADDKLLAKRLLGEAGVPVSPTLASFSTFHELGGMEERLAGLDEFVIKPARSSGGRGIVIVAGRDDGGFRTAGGRRITMSELRRHVADIVFGVYAMDRGDVAIVEPRLRPHPFFAALYPDGLSDIRVIALDDEPLLSMIRLPTRASGGRANLHQGAIGLGLDLADGTITRAWHRKREIAAHPDTGEALVGQTVPGWGGILAISRRVAAALPLKYLGIDLVVDRDLGPLVLEVNARPGLEIQNVTGVSLQDLLRARGVA
jgi:alpha-L-glutamate ligase-like protein